VTLSFFYGWIIVGISMIAGFFSAGVSNITMSVVLKPISDELGWSRALTAAAVTMGALIGGALSAGVPTAPSAAFSILSTKAVWDSARSWRAWRSISRVTTNHFLDLFRELPGFRAVDILGSASAGEQDLRRRMMLKRGETMNFHFEYRHQQEFPSSQPSVLLFFRSRPAFRIG
jgi:hypothetical protein